VRDEDGLVHVASGRKTPPPDSVLRVPLARGVVRLTEMVLLLPKVRNALPAARPKRCFRLAPEFLRER